MGAWVFIIGWLINGCVFGFAAQHVAESKGYDTGFAWGFWLGVIGVVVVGLRPTLEPRRYDSPGEHGAAHLNQSASPYAPNPVGWTCICGAKNPASIDYCLSCRRERAKAIVEHVSCPHCGARNRKNHTECFACGKSLREAAHMLEAGGTSSAELAQDGDFAQVLEKLAQLYDRGILTEEEYRQKKAEILSRI